MHRWVALFLLFPLWLLLQTDQVTATTSPPWLDPSQRFPDSTQPAHLTAQRRWPLATLVEAADLIVRGQVTAVRSVWAADHSIIESEVTIAVAYTLFGNPQRTVTIRTPGGYLATEGLGMVSLHAATFVVGEEVLAFAYQQGAHWQMVNGATGKFLIQGDQVANPDLALAQPLNGLLPTVVELLRKRGAKAQLPVAWRYLYTPVQPAAIHPLKVQTDARKWATPHPTVTYRINLNTTQVTGHRTPTGGNRADFRNAILAAAASWSTVTSAEFTLSYGGATEATKTSYNGVNEVLFMHKGVKERAAAAQVWYTDDQTIVEADIWINDDYTWSAVDATAAHEVDLQSALLHEFGHWLVLGHFTDTSAVMFPRLTTGTQKRTLQQPDVLGISAIYPR